MTLSKEELFNTYIENDKGELRDLYFSAIEKSGLETKVDGLYSDYNHRFISVLGDCNYVQSISDPLLVRKCKKLTLSDLKPRTKVEHEMVSINEVDESMLDIVFIDPNGDVSIRNASVSEFLCCQLYRKVERPVEWWEDAASHMANIHNTASVYNEEKDTLAVHASMTRDQWCDFARILLEQEGE